MLHLSSSICCLNLWFTVYLYTFMSVQIILSNCLIISFMSMVSLLLILMQTDEQCCNSCEEVREAYRKKGWALSNMDLIDQVGLILSFYHNKHWNFLWIQMHTCEALHVLCILMLKNIYYNLWKLPDAMRKLTAMRRLPVSYSIDPWFII